VVADNPMDYNKDTDYYSGVSKVLAAKPDVLFIGGASEPSALVVKQARELGFKGGFIVMDQAKLDEMAAVVGGLEMLEGAVGVLPLVYDEDPEAKDFVKRYQAKFGKTPGSEAGYHYMTTYIMVEAMKIAGTTSDPAKIRAAIGQAMKAIPDEHNPMGIRDIDEKGGFAADTPVATVVDGKIRSVRTSEIMGGAK